MKRIISLTIILALVMSLSCAAFAADDGSITINGIVADTTYEIYRLLDLESYDKGSGAYSYKVASEWATFFETAEAKAYVTIDAAGYVSWVAGEDDATVAAFAQIALAYAKANGIAVQRDILRAGGTDAGVMSVNRGGVITGGQAITGGNIALKITGAAISGCTITNGTATTGADIYFEKADGTLTLSGLIATGEGTLQVYVKDGTLVTTDLDAATKISVTNP